jgi:hypothetical protein
MGGKGLDTLLSSNHFRRSYMFQTPTLKLCN